MYKTDIQGINAISRGVFTNTDKGDEYTRLKAKAINDLQEKERINNIEKDVSNIKDMLELILQKVNQ